MDNLEAFPNPAELLKQAGAVEITFWWIRTRCASPEYQFIYGQVLTSRCGQTAVWRNRKLAERSFPDSNDRPAKRLIYESRCALSSQGADKLLSALRTCSSISSACATVELAEPFSHATYGFPEGLTPVETIFCSPTNARFGLPSHLRGRASLLTETGGLLARWIPQERLHVLSLVTNKTRNAFAAWLAKHVGEAAGIDLRGSAADAFGCIEIWNFPALDSKGRLLVKIALDKNQGAVALLRLAEAAPPGNYTAQIRAETLQDIYSDSLVTLPGDCSEVVVPVPPHCDGIIIRVWRGASNGIAHLWHEEEQHFLREIHISGSMMGLQATVNAEWLDEAKRSRKHPAIAMRAQNFAEVSQVGVDMPIEINHRDDWENNIKTVREFLSATSVVPSEGKFFVKGWGERHEKLEFAEWLKQQLSVNHARAILLDPYFDAPGLDLISRANGKVSLLQVVTSTRLKSEDDKDDRADRRTRIDIALKSLFPVLAGLKLQVIDLQKNGGGDSRVFHDRYLIFLGKDDYPKKGFNLSTSLQSATRTTPLLVTPIPADVLPQVTAYVMKLLSPDESDSHQVERIFPVESPRRKLRREGLSPEGFRGVARLLEVIDCPLGSADVSAELRRLGLLSGKGIDSKLDLPLSNSHLVTIASRLTSDDLADAAMLWDGVVEASLKGLQGGLPPNIEKIFAISPPAVGRFLRAYLEGHASRELSHEGSYEHRRTLSHFFELDFKDAIRKSESLNTHHQEFPIETSWAIHFAVATLLRLAPQDLDICVANLVNGTDQSGAVLSAIVANLATVSQRTQIGDPNFCLNLSSELGRALGVIALWKQILLDERPFSDLLTQISTWVRPERLSVLAYCIRAQSSEERRNDDRVVSSRRADFVSALTKEQINTDEVLSLARSWSWSLGGDAKVNNNEILCPLVEARLFPSETAFLVWDTLLIEREKEKFSRLVDSELVQIWGGTFWFASADMRENVLQSISKELKNLEDPLRAPLLYARKFGLWKSHSERLMRQFIRLWSIEKARPLDEVPIPLVSELRAQAATIINEELILERDFGELLELVKVAMTIT